ncbi:thiamine pyrophosphate-binding protein, partial [Kibdelosporangium lantanae]
MGRQQVAVVPTEGSEGPTVRDAVRALCASRGVRHVFGNPGTTEAGFLADWPEDWTYVPGLQESIVVAMADGYAQATGQAAVVNLHSAAGVGHAMGSIVSAWHNHAPMVDTHPVLLTLTTTYQPATDLGFLLHKHPERAQEFPVAAGTTATFTVTTDGGTEITADIWFRTFGSRVNTDYLDDGRLVELTDRRTVPVDDHLNVVGAQVHENVYAVGDIADLPDAKMATHAMVQAQTVIENLRAQLRGER